MVDKNAIWTLFDLVIDDKFEKKIMNLIIDGKSSDEIIEELLREMSEGVNND